MSARTWPAVELVNCGGPEVQMAERITRYQANVLAIRKAGYTIPSPMLDSLDASQIETWLLAGDAMRRRVADLIRSVAQLPEDTMFPSLLTSVGGLALADPGDEAET